jgi:hypothetical protein
MIENLGSFLFLVKISVDHENQRPIESMGLKSNALLGCNWQQKRHDLKPEFIIREQWRG